MQVHHSKNEDDILILRIDYAARKAADLAPSYAIFKNGPSIWETEYILNCRMDFYGEIGTETWFAIFIVVYGSKEFCLSFRMKSILHLANRLRTSEITSSPGIGFTFPERSSWRRLFATSVHLVSMAMSGTLRLRKSESAISALSSTGRERACSISFLVVIMIEFP